MRRENILLLFLLFIISVPLLEPWYIFLLDRVIHVDGFLAPRWSNNIWVGWLSQVIVWLGIPMRWLQKFLLVLIFGALVYWGIYLRHSQSEENDRAGAGVLISLVLVFNPFFYERFMDGQLNVLLSYIGYPFLFWCMYRYFVHWGYRYLVGIGMLSLFLCLSSIHNAFFIAGMWVVSAVVCTWIYRSRAVYGRIFLSGCAILLCNAIWLVPVLTDSGEHGALVDQATTFTEPMFYQFQSYFWWHNIYLHHATMQGYRWAAQWNYKIVGETVWSYQIGIVLLVIALFAFAHLCLYETNRNRRFLGIWIGVIAFLWYFLSLWVSSAEWITQTNLWLYEHLPYYAGMREPHKWILFVCIFTAYMLTYFVQLLYRDSRGSTLFLYLVYILPILFTPYVLWWFWWQIQIDHYPSQRQEVRTYLASHVTDRDDCEYIYTPTWETKRFVAQKCHQVIAYPWHGYVRVPWTERIVLWSVYRYFDPEILYGDNSELVTIYSRSRRPESKIIEKYIAPWWEFRDGITEQELEASYLDHKWLGLQYIVLAHQWDYEWYVVFLDLMVQQWYLDLVLENDEVSVYNIL